MRTRWNTLGLAFAFAVCSFGANAQTFSWNWTGFYVGVDAGIISSRSFSSTQATFSPNPYLLGTPGANGTISAFNNAAVDTLSARGTEGGVHAGYNWQLRPITVGFEIDYAAFKTSMTRDATFGLASGIVSQLHSQASTKWLFTARPRVGWVYGALFGYITGGIAFTTFDASTIYSEAGRLPNGFVSTSQSKAGWTMGAGLEVAIAPRWTLRAEYMRVEFTGVTGAGSITNPGSLAIAGVTGGPGTFNPISLSADHKSDLVRVGVTHKFQWWFEEPVPSVAPGPVVVTKD
jgi:outer membrane immunogenic protein